MKFMLVSIVFMCFCVHNSMEFLSNNRKLISALKSLREAGMKKQRRHFHKPSFITSSSSSAVDITKSHSLARHFSKKQIHPITINCAPYCTRLSSTGHYSIKQCWSCKKKMTCVYCRIAMKCNRKGSNPL